MGSSAVNETSPDPVSQPQVAAWSPPPSESPGAWGMLWAVSLGPSGLLETLPGLLPMHPRVMCSPPMLESALGSPHGPRAGRGPTWMGITLAFIPCCNQFGNSDEVSWGLFQNILRSVPTRQREVEGESCGGSQAWWPPSHTLADPYALSRWDSSRQQGHFAQSCRGLCGSQQLAPCPLGGLQAMATH